MFYVFFSNIWPLKLSHFDLDKHTSENTRRVTLCPPMTKENEARRVQSFAWYKTESEVESQTPHKASWLSPCEACEPLIRLGAEHLRSLVLDKISVWPKGDEIYEKGSVGLRRSSKSSGGPRIRGGVVWEIFKGSTQMLNTVVFQPASLGCRGTGSQFCLETYSPRNHKFLWFGPTVYTGVKTHKPHCVIFTC